VIPVSASGRETWPQRHPGVALAESYAKAGLTDKAKQYLTKIIDKYGDTGWGAKARARLAEIDGK